MSTDSGCVGRRRVHDVSTRATGLLAADDHATASPGHELWTSGVPREARTEPLTWPERVWVYNVFALLPLYAAGIASSAVVAGANVWRSDSFSPWVTLTIVLVVVAVLHLWSWFLETALIGRRSKAVLSRPLRQGRHAWAVPSGDRVRVYAIEHERTVVPPCLAARARGARVCCRWPRVLRRG